ncbi:MAG TPA: RdgB/HAM1 family non-canonical purine NTP pyrophosphatase [Phycisphaerales bacterium]|nr:RdgB/HAM1 family non-canonical purine NTP pyrophosphatase [Phycisphaerales bacterium]
MKQTILVATTNPGKVKELAEMLADAAKRIQWVSLGDFPEATEVVEDGATFAQNARKKALGYAEQTGLWTLADDSGLAIDALDGAPGVRSARFAADEAASTDRKAIDRANYEKVLRLMDAVPDARRTARFVCHVALAQPGNILLEAAGCIDGVIGREPKGENGFGYDPVFYIPSLGKTAAELDSRTKNRISHRGRAIALLKPRLYDLLT